MCSAEVDIEKPDRRIFLKALEMAACAPNHSVMVGDRPDNDIQPASELGMWTIRVLQGPARTQIPKPGQVAHQTVPSIAVLPSVLL